MSNVQKLDCCFLVCGNSKKTYQELSKTYSAIEPPTWALLLAESTRAVGFNINIIDANAENLSEEEIHIRIKKLSPKLICFVAYGQNVNAGTVNMTGVIHIASYLAKKNINIPMSIIGSHVQALPIETLKKEKMIDFVFTNEGVYALRNILRLNDFNSKNLSKINGIAYRDGEEIKVMVRYPSSERSSVGDVADVMIKTQGGAELPLSELADIILTDGVTRIRRENGNRTINVWANVDAEQVEPFKVTNDISDNYIPQLLRKYPLVKSEVTGSIQEEMDSLNNQIRDFVISLMVIFSLLAIPLRSYSQATMIMVVIPFGIIGSVFGHLLMGMNLNALSVLGILAASGVVVNDSLVMVDYVNNARKRGETIKAAVIHAGTKRFRAILLTSITTFIGLVPIVFFETSLQAQFVIPMAVSLAFGVLFATVVTLLLIPSLYLVIEDIKQVFSRRKGSTIKVEADKEQASAVS